MALLLSYTWSHQQQRAFLPRSPVQRAHSTQKLAKADKSIQSGEPRSVPDMHILIDVVCASTARVRPVVLCSCYIKHSGLHPHLHPHALHLRSACTCLPCQLRRGKRAAPSVPSSQQRRRSHLLASPLASSPLHSAKSSGNTPLKYPVGNIRGKIHRVFPWRTEKYPTMRTGTGDGTENTPFGIPHLEYPIWNTPGGPGSRPLGALAAFCLVFMDAWWLYL
jgi:hypothetical protein